MANDKAKDMDELAEPSRPRNNASIAPPQLAEDFEGPGELDADSILDFDAFGGVVEEEQEPEVRPSAVQTLYYSRSDVPPPRQPISSDQVTLTRSQSTMLVVAGGLMVLAAVSLILAVMWQRRFVVPEPAQPVPVQLVAPTPGSEEPDDPADEGITEGEEEEQLAPEAPVPVAPAPKKRRKLGRKK